MKFLSFFPSSLWYALGGAFCTEVVGIFGVVGVVGVVSRSWRVLCQPDVVAMQIFMSEHNVRVTTSHLV